MCNDPDKGCGKCGKWINQFAHDKKPIDIYDTIECSGTIVGHTPVNIYYLIMRFVFAIIITIVTLWSLISWTAQGLLLLWPFYITHWGLSVNIIYIWSVTYLHYKIFSLHLNDENVTQGIKSINELNLRFSWNFALYFIDVSVPIAVFVIFLFWALVYDGGEVKPISWNTHGTVGVLLVIEWFTSSWQLTYKGSFFVLCTAAGWVFLSILFYAAGGEDGDGNPYLYAVINWGESPGAAFGYSVVVCVAMPTFHILMVALKNALMKKWLETRTDEEKDLIINNSSTNKNDVESGVNTSTDADADTTDNNANDNTGGDDNNDGRTTEAV